MTSSSSATGCDSPSTCPTNSSIAHPDADASLGFTIPFGGPALFLLAQLLFHHAALGRVPRSRALGLAALAILAIATAQLMLIAGITACSTVLIAVAITRHGRRGRQAPGRSA